MRNPECGGRSGYHQYDIAAALARDNLTAERRQIVAPGTPHTNSPRTRAAWMIQVYIYHHSASKIRPPPKVKYQIPEAERVTLKVYYTDNKIKVAAEPIIFCSEVDIQK